jgi:hypothetical protein
MIDDHFPDEYPFEILLQTPWFDDIFNYLMIWRFPQHIPYRDICKIVRKSTQYNCIERYFFNPEPDQILVICIREYEVHEFLHAFHD